MDRTEQQLKANQVRASGHANAARATLPAGAWSHQATIPVVDGINRVKAETEETMLSFAQGDSVGNYTLTKYLCRGAKSTLFLAQNRRQERFVVKLYEPGKASTTLALRKLADLLRRNGCPSLMPLLSFGDLEQGIHYEVMPVYQQGTLEGTVLTEKELVQHILPQLNEALKVLGENHLVHNDIKPANLFWRDREKMEIALGDYDCIAFDKDGEAGGTLLFMAPERIYSRGRVHMSSSDYCSMGLTLVSLLTGRTLPDEGAQVNRDDPAKLQEFLYRRWQRQVACPPALPVSPKTRDLLDRLLQTRPQDRCSGEFITSWIENGGLGIRTYHETVRRKVIKGLRYQGRLILDIAELIGVLGTEWDFGTFLLKQHQLDDFLRQFDGAFYRYSQKYASADDSSAGLFMLMQSVSPSTDFYWKGKHYESLEDFVDRTEAEESYGVWDPFCHFCRAGLLSFYEEKNGAGAEQIERAKEIEAEGKRQPELAVKKLQISLRQKPDFVWHGNTFAGIDDLFAFFADNKSEMDQLVAEFCDSKAARVWLDYIGQGSFLPEVEQKMMNIQVSEK